MAHVTVDCPECRRCFVVNGRGRCRCGAYLIDHIGRGKAKYIFDPERTYLHRDGRWLAVKDVMG